MTDEANTAITEPAEAEPAEPERPGAASRRRVWRRRARRFTKRGIIVGVALVAAALVSSVTLDLGPALRGRAEAAASALIDREVTIGRLGMYILPGRFLIEDLEISGLEPEHRPYFQSDRIMISTSWLALLGGEIMVDEVDMHGWRMLAERLPDGRNSFPDFDGPDDPGDDIGAEAARPEGDETLEADLETGRRLVTTVQYLRAHEGEFTYEDHDSWSVTARNIDLTINKTNAYGGQVSLNDGTLHIDDFEEMTVAMDAIYALDGTKVHLSRIELAMDGFESIVDGDVDLGNWPEQTYRIRESTIDLPTMKNIFFADDEFTVTGDSGFIGEWHIFDNGRELTGRFESDDATLNDLAFPDLEGALVWTDDRFEVFDYRSDFYGGELQLTYRMAPLGKPTPGMHALSADLTDVGLVDLFAALDVRGVRPDGYASGTTRLDWPMGEGGFDALGGDGRFEITPPDGTRLALPGEPAASRPRPAYAAIPFDSEGAPWRFPVGGDVAFELGPEWIEVAPGRLATPLTAIEFEGRTADGDRSHLPFHVTSLDWQESARLMAAILTAQGSPSNEVAVGGRGELDGVMLGDFSAPRIEASFEGQGVTAWDVAWGMGGGAITVENAYVDVVGWSFDDGTARLEVDGRFSLGYPRNDGGEEINARFRMEGLPSTRVRRAFHLEGYEIDGPIYGALELSGAYDHLVGSGRIEMAETIAYGEPFDSVAADLRFEGDGVRLAGLEARKGEGRVTGAAFVRWDGTYSVNADGRELAVETIDAVRNDRLPLGGTLQFSATGAGAFEDPRYDVNGTVTDLSIGGEVVGQVTGHAEVRSGVLGVEVEAGSPSLAISGSGQVELTPEADAQLQFRFTNTALHRYISALQPERAMPEGTTAVASGVVRVSGPVRAFDRLVVEATVEQADLAIYDYAVRNDGPVQLALDRNVVRVGRLRLIGEGTALALTGEVGLGDERVALHAEGDASLGILQGFLPDIRSSGDARLSADIGGSFRAPVIVGEAAIENGRLRHFSLPHALEAIGGRLMFEPGGIVFDDLTGELGGGPVRFGGRVGLVGYELGALSLTAVGTEMAWRYPEGVRSLVDAELTLRGDATDLLLAGTINVRDAVWLELFDQASTGIISFGGDDGPQIEAASAELPLRFDLSIEAPSSLRISDRNAQIVLSAELTLGGSYDRPLLFGNAEVERGQVFFEGNRYRVTRGSISFANPTEIEPFFDIEAETDVRVPGQTYRVTLGLSGTVAELGFELSSDPPLQQAQIFAMLLGDRRDPQQAELRTLRAREASQQQLFQAGAARLLTSPLSSGVSRVMQDSFGVDTFEITPSLDDLSAQQSSQLVPTARVLIGKRISDRAYVAFSRALSGSNRDLLVVLEYDQSDRLSWVFSQNEDRTYALDFRVRHAF